MSGTLVYDGGCGFCTASVRLALRLGLRPRVVVPYQEADLAALGLTEGAAADAVQWVGDDGARGAGHEAVALLLQAGGPGWSQLGRLLLSPPLSVLAAAVYRLVARHRGRLPGGPPACSLPPEERPHAG